MSHIVLLGDSIFDNRAYVKGGADVQTHLRKLVPPDWKVTLVAFDGSVTTDVLTQLPHIPPDATHLAVSAGGNDALLTSEVLFEKASSVAEVLNRLAETGEEFHQDYHRMLEAILALGKPTTVCTIYSPNFSDPSYQLIAATALSVLNDIIMREAFSAGIPLIDLRMVCTERTDYANEIEPSASGGAKIAEAIYRAVSQHDFSLHRTQVFF